MKFVPMNFGYVEEKIFRSAAPEPRNFPFLETLCIKTCIVLQSEGPSEAFGAWLRESNVAVIAPLMHGGAASRATAGGTSTAIVESVVIDAVCVLLNPAYYPVLVCCAMGRYWTGTVVGCLRKVQRWNLTSILEEYRRFGNNNKGRLENEEFIELFDVEMVHLPPSVRPSITYFQPSGGGGGSSA